MNLHRLNELIKKYDRNKGWLRRLFGDVEQIVALKMFIKQEEERARDRNQAIRLSEFRQFVAQKGIDIDLSSSYYLRGSESGQIFVAWIASDAIQNQPLPYLNYRALYNRRESLVPRQLLIGRRGDIPVISWANFFNRVDEVNVPQQQNHFDNMRAYAAPAA